MEKIPSFAHYYEFFAGSNAALLSFEELRKKIFSFFSTITCKKITTDLSASIANLSTILEYEARYKYYHNTEDSETQETEGSSPFREQGIDLDQVKEQHKKLKEIALYSINKIEEFCEDQQAIESVTKKTYPLFVVCLIYCIMMVLLGGIIETDHHLEQKMLIFLSYFNFLLAATHIYKTSFRSKRGIKKRHLPNVLQIKNSEHLTGSDLNKNILIYLRNFVLCFAAAVACVFSNNYLQSKGWAFVPTLWPLVITSALIICAFPIINLIFHAVKFKNGELDGIYETFIERIKYEKENEPASWRFFIYEEVKSIRKFGRIRKGLAFLKVKMIDISKRNKVEQ